MTVVESPQDTSADAVPPASGPAGPLAYQSSLYDPSTPMGQVSLAFKRGIVAVRRLRGRETQRTGQISFAQHALLHGLAGSGPCSARELAELTDLSPASVTQMLEHLENSGLVTRTRSELDRRIVLSVLTERGASVLSKRQTLMERRWRESLEGFTDDELSVAARVLDRLADYFNAQLEDGYDNVAATPSVAAT